MSSAASNFTIIVNWKERGFGCRKACGYCNWRDSALLPHGVQSKEAIDAFVRQCRKSFITISGGADPLYDFEVNHAKLLSTIRIIQTHRLKVRLITREIEEVGKLNGFVDYVSISLETDVLEKIPAYEAQWHGMDVEFSLVLPPLPTSGIVQLLPQYESLWRRLGRRLVLRENLNSIFHLDFTRLSFRHSGIVFVPRSVCLQGRYLAKAEHNGHDIIQDNAELLRFLLRRPDAFLFGGVAKHLAAPYLYPEYGDIDILVTSQQPQTVLEQEFGYVFKQTSPESAYPRYCLGRSKKAAKPIQLIRVASEEDAKRFIFSGQYDVDRIGFNKHRFFCDPTLNADSVLQALKAKHATRWHESRDMQLFHESRPQIEQRHKMKLIRRGFHITEQPEL